MQAVSALKAAAAFRTGSPGLRRRMNNELNFPPNSAVSTPIFASKYSLESSRRDLHKALLCTVLQTQNFSQKSSSFFRDWIIEFPIFFIFCVDFCNFFCEFLMKFCPDFATNSRKEWRVSLFQSKLRKKIRKLPKILKSVKIIHYYSLLFIRALRQKRRPRSPPRFRCCGRVRDAV